MLILQVTLILTSELKAQRAQQIIINIL